MNIIRKICNWYFSRTALPYWCILLLDCTIVFLSGIVIFYLRQGGIQLAQNFWPLATGLAACLAVFVLVFRIFHTFLGFMRYSSFVDLYRLAYSNATACIGVCLLHQAQIRLGLTQYLLIPRFCSIIEIFILATLLMWAVRIVIKTLHDIYRGTDNTRAAFIYGCMEGGIALAKSIRSESPARYRLKGFISTDPSLSGSWLLGVKVYEDTDDLVSLMKEKRVSVLLVSPIQTERFTSRSTLIDALIGAGIKIYMMSSAEEWDGKSELSHNRLREVEIEDLLPRDKIEVDMAAIGSMLQGKRILITGAAGSIGSEMARQVARFQPSELILIDQAETPMHDMRLWMNNFLSSSSIINHSSSINNHSSSINNHPSSINNHSSSIANHSSSITNHSSSIINHQSSIPPKIFTIVGSITNQEQMEKIFSEHRPEYVFHAAAYKHVPMMEDNPGMAVQNNIYGTRVIADLAVKYGTKKFVMISTDKAVNPTNVMGCSKRICEIYCQSLNAHLRLQESQNPSLQGGAGVGCQFITTRFGNVLGSNGSVIPIFREQIRKGGPVMVTHPDIIRFFMLIPEACRLVLEAGTMGKGGEIFVFDMGEPVRIVDLAKRMIALSGAKNVEIKFSGLREGEKLYEEVLNDAEQTKPTVHPKIKVASVREYPYELALQNEKDLYTLSFTFDDMAIVQKMKEIVPEYKSRNSKYEILDK